MISASNRDALKNFALSHSTFHFNRQIREKLNAQQKKPDSIKAIRELCQEILKSEPDKYYHKTHPIFQFSLLPSYKAYRYLLVKGKWLSEKDDPALQALLAKDNLESILEWMEFHKPTARQFGHLLGRGFSEEALQEVEKEQANVQAVGVSAKSQQYIDALVEGVMRMKQDEKPMYWQVPKQVIDALRVYHTAEEKYQATANLLATLGNEIQRLNKPDLGSFFIFYQTPLYQAYHNLPPFNEKNLRDLLAYSSFDLDSSTDKTTAKTGPGEASSSSSSSSSARGLTVISASNRDVVLNLALNLPNAPFNASVLNALAKHRENPDSIQTVRTLCREVHLLNPAVFYCAPHPIFIFTQSPLYQTYTYLMMDDKPLTVKDDRALQALLANDNLESILAWMQLHKPTAREFSYLLDWNFSTEALHEIEKARGVSVKNLQYLDALVKAAMEMKQDIFMYARISLKVKLALEDYRTAEEKYPATANLLAILKSEMPQSNDAVFGSFAIFYETPLFQAYQRLSPVNEENLRDILTCSNLDKTTAKTGPGEASSSSSCSSSSLSNPLFFTRKTSAKDSAPETSELRAGNQQLQEKNRCMDLMIRRLRAENGQLIAENLQLTAEKGQLIAENLQLAAENQEFLCQKAHKPEGPEHEMTLR